MEDPWEVGDHKKKKRRGIYVPVGFKVGEKDGLFEGGASLELELQSPKEKQSPSNV